MTLSTILILIAAILFGFCAWLVRANRKESLAWIGLALFVLSFVTRNVHLID